jgi:hypothetical protein
MPALASVMLVVGSTLALAAAPVVGYTKTPWNTNLVKNPGFEAGAGTDGYHTVAIPGWSTYNGKATVVRYGAPLGFPSKAESNRINGGANFFASGQQSPQSMFCPVGTQGIKLRGRGAAIDADAVRLTISARIGTYDGQSDTATVTVNMYRSQYSGEPIASLSSPSMTATNSRLDLVTASLNLAPETRFLRVLLFASNTNGYCDAYFDKVSVKIVSDPN